LLALVSYAVIRRLRKGEQVNVWIALIVIMATVVAIGVQWISELLHVQTLLTA
jgi:hypothetical protein